MTNKICTSIEQSKKLIELGIDVYTADMYWKNEVSDKYFQCFTPFVSNGTDIDYDYDIPAWSLSVLLELIPPGNVLLRDALNSKYKCINTVDSDYYDNPLDAAFEMVCWLKENEKI
jgi:hypothetical protein